MSGNDKPLLKHNKATLGWAAEIMQGQLLGVENCSKTSYSGVCTDTRKIMAGQLYVALKGPHFDGHDFVADAISKGAVAVVVSHDMSNKLSSKLPLDPARNIPQIVVADTQQALGLLASGWRDNFAIPVIAVTGSNGKTTVKEMLAAILSQSAKFSKQGKVLATQENFNNEIGVPLTLLHLVDGDSAAVIEEGASGIGDIAYLTKLVKPTVAVVTNASGAHLQGFGSLNAVARTKGEIFECLAVDGTAVINADDNYSELWHSLAGKRSIISFGMKSSADIRGEYAADKSLVISTPKGEVSVNLPLLGRHNAMNSLAAASAAIAVGASLSDVKAGLESMCSVPGRLQWKKGIKGARVLDDTYNANPVSLEAALEVLADCDTDRYLALGDMAELGVKSAEYHQQAGQQARAVGVQRLYAIGEQSRNAVDAFGDHAQHFAEHDQLVSQLREDLHDNVTLLVKGSRSAHMERVVDAVCVKKTVGAEGVS